MALLIRFPPQHGKVLSSWRQHYGLANGFQWFRALNRRPTGDPNRCPNDEEMRIRADVLKPARYPAAPAGIKAS